MQRVNIFYSSFCCLGEFYLDIQKMYKHILPLHEIMHVDSGTEIFWFPILVYMYIWQMFIGKVSGN